MDRQTPELARNPPRLAAYNGLQMMLFPVAIVTLYQREEIGLDMTGILLLQAFFGLAMAILEFPSGYLADRIGYRRTLILASAISVLGWTLYMLADDFVSLLVAEVVLGFSLALISGCDSALLYESLVETGQEREFTRWTGRVRFVGQGSEGTAALFAGVLFAISPQLPFLLQIPVWIANLFVAVGLSEPARHVPAEKNHFQHMVKIARGALIERPELRAIIALTVILGLSSFALVWVVPLYAVEAGLPVAWIGPMWTAANYVVAASALASDRLDKRLGTSNLVLLGIFLVAFGYAGLASVHAWWGFGFYFAVAAIRGLVAPALLHREQRLIPTADRASFLSLRSLIFRLSFLVLGPVVGVGIDEFGNHPALAVTGTLLVVSCLAAWWQARPALRTKD